MNKTFYLLTVLLAVSLGFCSKDYENSLKKETKKPPVVFIGIDGSGSYNYFEKGKLQIKRIINFIPPGTDLFIRLITSDSYLDDNSIVTKSLPQDPKNSEENPNPFDIMEKAAKDRFIKRIKEVKDELSSRVSNKKYPESDHTDIYGFILYIQENGHKGLIP